MTTIGQRCAAPAIDAEPHGTLETATFGLG